MTSELTSNPPMGWGLQFQTTQQKLDDETRARDELAEIAPERLARHTAKQVFNQELLEKTKSLMQQDGIESGFSFLHLHKAIYGEFPSWRPQLIGSCVASGDKETTAARCLAEVFLFNQAESLPGSALTGENNLSFFAPFNYRAGRKLAGINGMGDGSLCMPHIRGKMQFGHLPCNTPGLQSDAFPEPQMQTSYKLWGANDQLLNQHADSAKKFVLLESEKVRTPQDMFTLHTEHFKPANICSDWAFKRGAKHPSWRLADGSPVYIWERDTRNQWAHNMSRMGYVVVSGARYAIIKNTWGPFHDGRDWFVISETTDEAWLRKAECQTVGDMALAGNPPAWPQE